MHVQVIQVNWKWLIVLGAVLMLLGVTAMGVPVVFVEWVDLFIGIALALSGIVQLVHAVRLHRPKGFFFSVPSAVVQIGVGAWLVYSYKIEHRIGLLIILLTLIVLAQGAFKLYWSFTVRPDDNWIYLLVSAVVSFLIAAALIFRVLGSEPWAVGVLIGFSMLSNGFTMTLLGIMSYVPGAGSTDVEVPIPTLDENQEQSETQPEGEATST